MGGKSIFKSKTFIVSMIAMVLGILNQLSSSGIVPPEYANYLVMAIAGLTALARYFSDNVPIKPLL